MKKAVLFDMFFTLADPRSETEDLECAPLGLSPQEWRRYFWNEELCRARALGDFESPEALIERTASLLPFPVSKSQKNAVLKGRLSRMSAALTELRPGIAETLQALRAEGFRLAVVSNADIIDIAAWSSSPLVPFFDAAVFSCLVRKVKPEPPIYLHALAELGVSAELAVFVGDGGDKELAGAKAVGLTTVWTEYLQRKDAGARALIAPYADYHIDDIRELIRLIPEI